MNRQTALWSYMMTPRQRTGLEGRKRFRQPVSKGPFWWLRKLIR